MNEGELIYKLIIINDIDGIEMHPHSQYDGERKKMKCPENSCHPYWIRENTFPTKACEDCDDQKCCVGNSQFSEKPTSSISLNQRESQDIDQDG